MVLSLTSFTDCLEWTQVYIVLAERDRFNYMNAEGHEKQCAKVRHNKSEI